MHAAPVDRWLLVASLLGLLGACSTFEARSPSAPIPPTDGASPLQFDEPRSLAAVPDPPEPKVDLGPALARGRAVIETSSERARERVLGWRPPLPEQPSYRTLLEPSRTLEGPLSIGTPGEGTLRRGTRLPDEGDHYAVVEAHRDRRTHYGTDELIRLVRDAAAEVAEAYPGSTLKVGNLSRKHGGDIRWSHSHNSGRDVDFAFYCRRAEDDRRVPAPKLVALDASGRSKEPTGYVFDAARNWALVAAMLSHPTVDIQRIFVSNALREMLLSHARSHGASDELIDRAEAVMMQPIFAEPHDDHFHVRITCSRRDRLEGCLNYGPRWSWADWHERDVLARSLALAEAFEDGSTETTLAALEELKRIESPYAPELALVEAAEVGRAQPEVRAKAIEVATSVAWWSTTAVKMATELIDRPETTRDEKEDLYALLRRGRDPLGHRFAFSKLLTETTPSAERRLAARALHHALDPGMVPALVDELAEQPPEVRAEIAVVLRRTTAHTESVDWSSAAPETLRAGIEAWSTWWDRHRDAPRRAWVRESLREHGVEGREVASWAAVDSLIPLVREAPDHVAYNANRLLHRITDRWIPLEGWSDDRLHAYWSNWWETNRDHLPVERHASAAH